MGEGKRRERKSGDRRQTKTYRKIEEVVTEWALVNGKSHYFTIQGVFEKKQV